MTHVSHVFLFMVRFAPFTSCWLFSPTAALRTAVLWVIPRDVWSCLQLLNEIASPVPTSPSFQVCTPVDSKIWLFQSLLSPGCCRPGCCIFWLFPGLLCSHFCFFILFDFCYHTWLFTGRPSLWCRGRFLIICLNYLKLLSALEFN